MCAAVLLRACVPDLHLDGLGDSKTVSPKRRARLHAHLRAHPGLLIATSVTTARDIDRVNILEARRAGLAAAVASLSATPEWLFVDGDFTLPDAPVALARQRAVVRGDASISVVAAASIVAKEVRDAIMRGELADSFPQFEFERHKGYATARHRQLLRELGPCAEHRFSYRPVREAAAEHCVPTATSLRQ